MIDLDAVINAVDETMAEAKAFLNGAPDIQGNPIQAHQFGPLVIAMGMFQTFRDKLIAAQKESYGG